MNEKFKQCIDSWFESIKNQKPNNLTKILESDFQSVESVLEQSKWFSESGYQVLVGILEQAELGTYTVENVRATCSYIRKKHGIARTVAPVRNAAAVTRKVDMSRAVGVSVSSPVSVGKTAAVPGAISKASPVNLPAPVSLDAINWLDEGQRLVQEEDDGIDTLLPQDITLHDYFLGLFKENSLDCVRDFEELFKKKIINEQKHEIMGKVRSKLMANGIKFRK